MAKVWDSNGVTTNSVLVEDPRAGNDGFYINGDKHDKTSLTPQYSRRINMQDSVGSTVWEFYPTDMNVSSNGFVSGLSLALSKLTVGVCDPEAPGTNSAGYYGYTDSAAWIDMSFNNGVGAGGRKGGTIFTITDGTDEMVVKGFKQGTSYYERAWPVMPVTTDLDQQIPTASPGFSDNYCHSKHHFWGKNFGQGGAATTFFPSLSSMTTQNSTPYNYPNSYMNVAYSNWPHSIGGRGSHIPMNQGTYYNTQFVGETADGGGLIMAAAKSYTSATSADIRIYKSVWNTSESPTNTELLHRTGVPAAAGTHQGGNYNNNIHFPRTFSQHFDDPRGTANTKVWFNSYYDTYGNWHPQVVTWNTSNDTFAVEHDVTCDVMSSTHSDMLSVYGGVGTSNYRTMVINCTTWTSGGHRYVCDFKVDGRSTYYENDAQWKTWVTYKMDPADPKTFTYHSKIEMPGHVRNWIWLNDSQTLMGVWFSTRFVVYAWNDTTGWTETTSINGVIYEVGRDSLDRIWYTKESTTAPTDQELHLLTPTLPVSISVTPELASYTYSGSDIVTNLAVSAINASGARIATSVKLTIEGSSMKFSDDTTTKTVTTLTSGDLSVATKVVGAGFTNVAASIEI
jgi:hypothetical protein